MPNSSIDLHLHSHYSDGQASPAEIIRYAADIGLKTISITDHDNMNGWAEAAFIAMQVGIELIPGIEFTARWDGCQNMAESAGPGQNVDILAYFINPQDAGLKSFCNDLLSDLQTRVSVCCEKISAAGYPIQISDVLAENPHYPGPSQLIRALYKRGHLPDWNSAFEVFAHFWPQVRTTNYSVQQVIEAAHAAGGVAILAHPIFIRCEGQELLTENDLTMLMEAGLDGLEIYHPLLDSSARKHFLALARLYDLLISGGSDEHGPDGSFSRIGSELITYPMLSAMRQRARQYASAENTTGQ